MPFLGSFIPFVPSVLKGTKRFNVFELRGGLTWGKTACHPLNLGDGHPTFVLERGWVHSTRRY